MKKINNIFKAACLTGLAAIGTTSCQDWLTVYPQTQIVEENFWEDKNDLEGVRYAAYGNMCSSLEKMVLWGDLRSDSYTLNVSDQSTSTQQLYQEIREAKLERDSAQAYFEWNPFYTTINYCNKVLSHGEEVLDKDKQFTPSEWSQMKAEVTGLRALNYFYLLRSFKDIPYSTKVINNDQEVETFGATNQLVVLDSLIIDLESVQGLARNRFNNTKDTKGMITNCAIYAMLSDMYLWRASLHEGRFGLDAKDTVIINNVSNYNRVNNVTTVNDSVYVAHTVKGDYQFAIDYADRAMAALVKQTEDAQIGQHLGNEKQLTVTYGLTNVNMIKNNFESFGTGNRPKLDAYDAIFSKGNSDESIFELQFDNVDSRSNGVVVSQWGYTTSNHLGISEGALQKIYGNETERTRDARIWFSAWNQTTESSTPLPGYYCFKWQSISVSMPDDYLAKNLEITPSKDGNSYRNWIIYRLSDVMLQKAEAIACMNGNKGNDAKEALRYVNAIHRRWYCNDSKTSTTQPLENVTGTDGVELVAGEGTGTKLGNAPEPTQGKTNYEIAVMNERQLEFLGEGKRWFDLVRYAERHAGGPAEASANIRDEREGSEEFPVNNGKKGVDQMVDDFLQNEFTNLKQTLKNRMKNRYGLYNIIHYMEIKAGHGKLEQNPVWNKSTYEK